MMDDSELKGLSDMVGPLSPPTPSQVADARAFVRSRARDAADCAELLCALGLAVAR